jgi:GxxExxY protein
MTVDELSEVVIGCGITVHTVMGPGLLESICRDCLVIELVANGLLVEVDRRIPVVYREQRIRDDLKIDLLVEGRLVVEVKCVEQLHPVHLAQVITYLKLSGFPAGLLMNFNVTSLRNGLRRLDHPEIYKRKREERLASENR